MLKFINNVKSLATFITTPKSAIELENEKLFSTAIINATKRIEIDMVLKKLLPGIERYKTVAKVVNPDMPWWVVCLEHAMEAAAFPEPFKYHLHCGDSLTGRTYHVPKGRPVQNPKFGKEVPSKNNPYSWEESAVDALKLVDYHKETNWSLGNILWEFEKFNGLGYRKYHNKVKTPYVWSYTNHYEKGKYVGDGKWDSNAISRQPGCAAYLLRLIEKGLVQSLTTV